MDKFTNDDAIKMLKSKMDGNTDTSWEWTETVRLAINALEEQKARTIKEKIANAKTTNWLSKGFSKKEIEHIKKSAKKEVTQ